MLSFANPAALLIALAIAPVALLYFLRMRFRRKAVGSTYLWKPLIAATSGGDALKRRSILLLLLQAAAIALAAFSAAGPALSSRRVLRPGTAFLIDVSASMAARDDGSKSRVEAAVEAARLEIAALGNDVPIMAFACSSTARPLLGEATLDKAKASAALRSVSAGSEAFAESPCADAVSAWTARNEGAWQARLFTDGGLDLGGRRIASAFGGSLGVVTVGSKGGSVGVTGLRLEREGSGPLIGRFTVWNGWPTARTARLRIARGKEELAAGAVIAAPGWSVASLDLPGALEDGAYTVSVAREGGDLASAPGDAYRLSVSARRALTVLLVGRSDPFLKAALAYGGIAFSSSPEFPEKVEADIVIVDSAGDAPSPVPSGARCNLLVFGKPPADAPFAARSLTSGPIVSAEPSHPLSRFVSWEGAKAEAARAYGLRAAADRGAALVLATAGGAPILVAWEKGGYRSLACGIDLARSDLGLKSAFPVLLQNFFQWCVPRVDDQSVFTLVAGETARRALGSAPGSAGGDAFKARGVEVERTGPIVSLTARDAGIFEWAEGSSKGYIAANVPAGELDEAPRSLQAVESGGGAATALASSEQTRTAPLGGWAALLLAACLAGEWIAWKGGTSRRRIRRGEAGA